MKRSEMLKVLSDALYGWECYKEEIADNCAKKLLDAIEELGMLPPNQLNGCVNNIRCEWEDENEQE